MPTRPGVEQSASKPRIPRPTLAPDHNNDDDDDDNDNDDDDDDDDHANDDEYWLCQQGPSGRREGTSPCQGGALGPATGISFDESPGD